VDSSSGVHDFFPSQTYAIAIPATILCVACSLVAIIVAFVIAREGSKQKNK